MEFGFIYPAGSGLRQAGRALGWLFRDYPAFLTRRRRSLIKHWPVGV